MSSKIVLEGYCSCRELFTTDLHCRRAFKRLPIYFTYMIIFFI